MADAKRWSFIAGEKGSTRVRAFDRGARGIYLEWHERTGGTAKRVRQALGHSDRDRAKGEAEALALAFRRHERAPRTPVTLGALFAGYLTEVTPGKERTSRSHDARCAELFCRLFGADRKPRTLSRREWDRFIADRRAGRVAPKGIELGKPVGARIVAYDLITLRAVLNWATMVSDGEGGLLLDRNPLKDLPLPRNESPARRVVTDEQYLSLRTAAATFDNPRVEVFLVLAHETGHRAASIRQLRWSDIDLERRVVTWRAEADKIGYEHTTPLTDEAVAVLRAEQARVATIGDAWVFPASRGSGPLAKDGAMHYWKRLAEDGGLPAGARYGWHSLRRKFATELKQTNLKDLCALGGWKAAATLLTCYVAPDEGTQREALASRRVLRSG
jgi:integrase